MQALKKNPEADLKLKYRKAVEGAVVVALILLIGTFYAFKKFETSFELPPKPDITIETVEIPPTQQIQRPPPPSRPAIPLESEDEDILDDVTIEDTEVTFEPLDELPPPPPPEEDEVFEFFAV